MPDLARRFVYFDCSPRTTPMSVHRLLRVVEHPLKLVFKRLFANYSYVEIVLALTTFKIHCTHFQFVFSVSKYSNEDMWKKLYKNMRVFKVRLALFHCGNYAGRVTQYMYISCSEMVNVERWWRENNYTLRRTRCWDLSVI